MRTYAKMKLEKDHVLGVQSPPRKSYNPFDSDDEIEATNGYAKSNLNGYDIKSFETNADSLTFHLDSSDVSWEEAILSHSQILSRSVPADSNGEEVPCRKDTELFTDKTVTECNLPDLMVCYKDNGYHSVKDIGIDEGMPLHDKVSIKSRDMYGSESMPVLGLNGDTNGGEHLKLSFMEGLKSRSENSLEKDVSSGKWPIDSVNDSGQDNETLDKQHTSDQCGIDDTTNLDEFARSSSKEEPKFGLENPADVVDTGKEALNSRVLQLDEKSDSSNLKMEVKERAVSEEEHGNNTRPLEKTHESSTMSSTTDSAEASTESSESVYEEATSSLSAELPASQESLDGEVTNALSYNSKVESGSIVLDFNSSTAKENEEEQETSEHIETVAKPPEAQSMSRIDEGAIMDSGADIRVHGETSFNAAMAPPSSITYMGPYAHTGNISLRSESSCGSTRSFAFPVLQAEWNTSPVRMAKVEKRNFRKQRGWVHSVMCCRF